MINTAEFDQVWDTYEEAMGHYLKAAKALHCAVKGHTRIAYGGSTAPPYIFYEPNCAICGATISESTP